MQVRLTDVTLDDVRKALEAGSFGMAETRCPVRGTVETVSIWTDRTDAGPCGYEVGLIRREVASFAPRYEVVLESNRIGSTRLTALFGLIAATSN